MGQQQLNSKKNEEDNDVDIISQICQQQASSIQARTIEAIRISESDKYQQQSFSSNPVKIQETESLCSVSKNKNTIQQKCILSGKLRKQSPNMVFSQWSERYCLLTQTKFTYNQNQMQNSQRAGVLNFNLLSCHVIVQSKNNKIQSFTIKVSGCDKAFIFSSQNKEQNKRWSDALIQLTNKSLGRQYNLTYLSHYNRFWRKDYFSEKEFRQTAETGDIILMRGLKQSAVMQRAITMQQFDHIALVVKNIKNQVLLFEANGGVGVGVMPWHRFISKNYYKDQQIVVYRKLEVERTKQFYEQIQQFVQRNMGRKYKFSVKKMILNRQSGSNDKKSYFCSSLIAKLYKGLELLDSKISSMLYMPHSFTEKQNLALKQNGKYGPARLGKQKIIVFEQRFFQQE